jgi:Uma2 family endonuclease
VDAMATETSFRSEETYTQVDFRRWLESRPASEGDRHYELIRGRIVMSPPSGAWHGCVGSELNGLLREQVKACRLGRLFDASVGFELPSGDTLQPDVAFVSRQRWEAGPRSVGNEFMRIVPSLVVEILSPSTARRDRTEKADIYAKNGVDEYWLVDLQRRAITIFYLAGGVFGPPTTVTASRIPSLVLPDLEACVEDVFAALD